MIERIKRFLKQQASSEIFYFRLEKPYYDWEQCDKTDKGAVIFHKIKPVQKESDLGKTDNPSHCAFLKEK